MEDKKSPFIPQLPGLLTGALIALFLSGKIIGYPKGTQQGGIIAGEGVAIILGVSFAIIAFVAYPKRRRK